MVVTKTYTFITLLKTQKKLWYGDRSNQVCTKESKVFQKFDNSNEKSSLHDHILFHSRMLMPKKNLVAIYEHLFKEGVMVAKKDTHLPKHPEIDVPNLQVMKTLNVSI